MASSRKNLRSQAQAVGGTVARQHVQDLLATVPDIRATGYVKVREFPFDFKSDDIPAFEAPFDAAAQLISALHAQDRVLGMWTARGAKGDKTRQRLVFSNTEDAVLARLLIDG